MSRQIGVSSHGYHAMSAAHRSREHHDSTSHPACPARSVRSARTPIPRCHICSYNQPIDEEQRPIYHHHLSMKSIKKIAMNSNMEYFCPSCMQIHGDYQPTDRVKILLTSSLLHQYWAPPRSQSLPEQYPGDPIHIDHVSIPGATVDTLQQAFRNDYEYETRGMDIVVVAYYNDFIRGRNAEDILRSYDYLAWIINSQARHHHPSTHNTLAVATLPYAPQLCWFADNGPFPTPDYVNHMEELSWLNDQITRFNQSNGTPLAPKFHTYGERTDNKQSRDRFGNVSVRHTRSHRWEHWREEQPQSMLHLCNQRRMVMGKAVANYFKFNT